MNLKKIIFHFCFVSVLIFSFTTHANAFQSFIVRHIRIQGLQHVKKSTVLNYIPIHLGKRFRESDSNRLIHALYDTGFFTADIRIRHTANTLIIQLIERPTISGFTVTGNKEISGDDINKVLKQVGLQSGNFYNPAIFDNYVQALKEEYRARGKYNAQIDVDMKPLPGNRVSLAIKINEGGASKVKSIIFVGNHSVKSRILKKQFTLSTSSLLTYFTHGDQFSQQKFAASLAAVSEYYYNHGYVHFRIESTDVTRSKDNKSATITVKVYEGQQYRLKGFDFSGKLVLPEPKLRHLVLLKLGKIFSRKSVTDAASRIKNELGNSGYGFPHVLVEPELDKEHQQIFIHFVIEPGQRYYVRRVNFTGNIKTADDVLRHAARQQEGALMSLKDIQETQRQLHILPYIEKSDVQTKRVTGANNQVDVDFNVKETPSTEARASVGYGTLGLEFNLLFDQRNFLGTGKNVGFHFNATRGHKTYSFNYYEPYYTLSGIGRGVNAYYQEITPGTYGVSGFRSEKYGGMLNYSVPYDDHSNFQLGYGFEHLSIPTLGPTPSAQLAAFLAINGTNFNELRGTASWSYNTYDKYPFPTRGINQSVSAFVALPVDSKSLEYYKLGYSLHWYYPLTRADYGDGYILTAQTSLAYGNSFDGTGLPFFENYYAGGDGVQGQVRGYDTYSLGPKDQFMKPIGANVLTVGTVGVILPYPFSRETLRVEVFADAGNVFSHDIPAIFSGTTGSGPLRYTAGVSLQWRSPFGPIEFSIAKALNNQPGDDTRSFGFSMSSGF